MSSDGQAAWRRAAELDRAAGTHLERYWNTGDPTDLERAISGYREALATAPAEAAELAATILNNLGRALESRFELTEDRSDLDQAIEDYERSIAGVPAAHRAQVRAQLAVAVRRRFADTGRASDLGRALDLLQTLITDGDADPADLRELSGALADRFELGGDPDDLDDSVEAARAALDLSGDDAKSATASRTSLANALLDRFDRTRRTGDLDEAVQHFRDSVEAARAESREASAVTIGGLASALTLSWSARGAMADLDEAIELYETALSWPDLHPSTRISLTGNLATALDERLHSRGDLSDLDREIELFRDVLAATAPDARIRPDRLHNLAVALRTRHLHRERADADRDLESALSLHREALALTPSGGTRRAALLNSLGGDLRAWFDGHDDLDHLLEAVRCFEEAVALVPTGSTDCPLYLNNLSAALSQYGDTTGDQAALQRAARLAACAVTLTSPGSPFRPKYQLNQANAVAELERHAPSAESADEASRLYRDAGRGALATAPEDAVAVAANWSEWAAARADWEQVAEAGAIGEQATFRLVSTQVVRTHQESWLRDVQGLSSRHAWSLVRLGRLTEAARVVESGRAVLLSEALQEEKRRIELVRSGHSGAADRYERAGARLAALAAALATAGLDPPAGSGA